MQSLKFFFKENAMKKWEQLAKRIQQESAILGSRNTAEQLRSLHLEGLAVFEERNEEIIVFGALWPTELDDFLEAGSFWVHKEHRGRKYSSKMFSKLLTLIPQRKIAIVVTHDPKVVHLLKKFGWRESNGGEWEEVVPFAVSCGPCDIIENHAKENCPYRAVEEKCRLFHLKP